LQGGGGEQTPRRFGIFGRGRDPGRTKLRKKKISWKGGKVGGLDPARGERGTARRQKVGDGKDATKKRSVAVRGGTEQNEKKLI